MAGLPWAVASTRHAPSPGSGWVVSGRSAAGGANAVAAWPGPGDLDAAPGPAPGPASENEGLPPTLGGW